MKKVLISVLAVITALCCVFLTACSGNKVKIGVQQGTTGAEYLKGNADMEFAGYGNIECKEFANAGLAVEAMKNGQISYVIVDNEPAKQLAAKDSDIKVIDIPLSGEVYAFGVDPQQSDLLTEVNTFIAEIKANGKLDEIFAKYDALSYDEEGNVTGGLDNITGIPAGTFNASNAAGQLVVATNAEFAPFEFKKGSDFVGIDMEIVKLLADKLQLELVIQNMDFDSVVTSVGKNGVDLAAAGLTVTPSRKQNVNFSSNYFEDAYQVLVVKKDNTEFDNCKNKDEVEEILKKK